MDGKSSESVTVSGLTAFVSANSGVLNKGSVNFGINSDGADQTTFIDDDDDTDPVDEVLTISFSESVFIDSFVTSNGNSATKGSYTIGSDGGTFSQVIGGGTVMTVPSLDGINNLLAQGKTFTIQQNSGAAGFSFDSITVSAVPEPASVALLSVGCVSGLVFRRRRKRAASNVSDLKV